MVPAARIQTLFGANEMRLWSRKFPQVSLSTSSRKEATRYRTEAGRHCSITLQLQGQVGIVGGGWEYQYWIAG